MLIWLVILMAVMAGLGYLGWRVGGIRMALGLLPLVLASLSATWLGKVFFWLDLHRALGLAGMVGLAIILGLGLGEAIRWYVKRRYLKDKERHQADRIAGVILGIFMATLTMWSVMTLNRVLAIRRLTESGQVSMQKSGSDKLAGALGSGVVGWLPGVGGYIRDVDLLVEFASASEDARQAAAHDLKLDELADLPEMQAVTNDDRTVADVQAAQSGSVTALLRLQRNTLIMDLIETDEIQRLLDRLTLEQLVERARVHADEEVRQRG